MPDTPSLDELKAFVIAARRLSFSAAARELGVTPSAVSRQVGRVESMVDQRLFSRQGRSLDLTSAGRLLLSRISPALQEIELACWQSRASRDGSSVLRLASVPTFTTRWLVPRLPSFLSANPGVTLSFCPHLAPGDPFPDDVDLAIRYGDGRWEGVVSDYIDGRRFVPVVAPVLQRRARLRRPQDAVRCERLRHVQALEAWTHWARSFNVEGLAEGEGAQFEQYAVLIQAAVSGLGLALVPEFLVGAELDSGTLVRPFDAPIDLDHGHYLCYRRERLESKRVVLLRDWLLREAANTPRR